MSIKEPITLFIAVYGAVLSTVSIIWNIYKGLSDKGKLNVQCYMAGVIHPVLGILKGEYLVYRITNTGTKPIIVNSLGARGKNQSFMMSPVGLDLPRELKPGEVMVAQSNHESMMEILKDDLLYFCAYDTLSKVYKTKKKDVEKIIKYQKDKKDQNSKIPQLV